MERFDIFFSLPLLFLSLSLFSFSSSADNSTQLSQTQTHIMVSLSRSLPSSSTNAAWNTTDPNPCSWRGVTCSSQVVTKLDFSGYGLSDAINSSLAAAFFDDLCRLGSLQSLNLSANAFTAIPKTFFSNCSGMSGLKYLNLSNNILAGPLQNFSSFGSLEALDLSYNNLSGVIDSRLDGLAGLKNLNFSHNSFTGTIPALGKALGLQELALSTNRFDGPLPGEIGVHKNLLLLDLSQNQIRGTIPDGIGELPKLDTLLLSSNLLGGQIPSSLSRIKTLSRFAANQNFFSGAIPSGLTSHLKSLDLSYNQLNNTILPDLLSSPTLESVDLTGNLLHGPIPANLSQNLYRLRLGGNALNGTIPQSVKSLSRLSYLELDGNHLDSQIPSEIGGCKNLTLLNLASNRMEGRLPNELGSLQQLVELKLQSNNLNGAIPDELFKLTDLNVLDLSHNSLTGVIPSAISSLKKLSNLNLQGNEFHGSIPDTISSLSSLIELQLGNNQLTGTVPKMPGNLGIALNLSDNLFSGSIPPYLGDLTELEVLDLSNNSFTGQVPSSFTNMRSLTLLDLSNNDLSGILPPFTKYVTVRTSGNKDLRNSTVGSNTNTVFKKKRSPVLIIVVAIVGAIVGLGLVAAVLMLMSYKRFYQVKDEHLQSGESTPQIINGCFITTNSIHKSSIDFSKTMEVVGNPSNIILKTRFSTYYKTVMPNGVSYSIKKLNWTDKIFQMGNHDRFGQELEILGKLSNTNIMVPLAYALTEDSAYLFYEDVHKGTVFDFLHKDSANALDWSSRYSIMLGVAQGLTFLHGCTQPVLLLDLSTKSIQLKSLKEPQIGDIELCKVTDPSKSTGSLSTVAGSVGYIPPEYAYTMKMTMAGNVYSFGVILLELLTGKPPVNRGLELAKVVRSFSAKPDGREQILDSRISKTSLAVRSQMLSVLKVALACVSISPEGRPKIRNVLRMLFNVK